MASMTVLDMVQRILSDLESDEVNSISDSVESQEVADILRDTYFNIIDGKEWPHLKQFFQLEAATAARPTHMSLPSNVVDVEYIKYDKQTSTDTFTKFMDVKYLTPLEFMNKLNVRQSDASTIDVVSDATGVNLNIKNDVAPTYYTSFDNDNIVMDSYDSAVDTTNLQQSKVQAYGSIYPTWTHSDTFTPDLPQQAFSYLLNEAKSAAFIIVKQTANPKAEQHSATQRRRMSQEAWRLQKGVKFPDFGRISKK
jgi:hypothetical protein